MNIRVLLTGCLLAGANGAMAFTPTTNVHNFGEVFIPRDARIGSQIAQNLSGDDQYLGTADRLKALEHQFLIGPRLPSIPAAYAGGDNALSSKGEHLYESGVPGVAIAAVHTVGAICSDASAQIRPNDKFMPFRGTVCWDSGIFYNKYTVYLVKTGEIPAGPHSINQDLYRVTLGGVPIIAGSLNARVTVAGCGLPALARSQIIVDLGEHDQPTLQKDGVTPAVEFSIPLENCTAGRYPPNMNWNYFTGNYANITLDPANGSTIIDARDGMLGLKPDSTAKGVAVQILRSDGRPLPLGEEVRLNHVQDGTTLVPLKARYKKRPFISVAAGSANASANFTVTFK